VLPPENQKTRKHYLRLLQMNLLFNTVIGQAKRRIFTSGNPNRFNPKIIG
jgi:hypothetical protein